jgi:hypothetical protein
MAKSPRTGVIVAIVVFVVLAIVIRIYSEPLYDMLLSLHGRPAGR